MNLHFSRDEFPGQLFAIARAVLNINSLDEVIDDDIPFFLLHPLPQRTPQNFAILTKLFLFPVIVFYAQLGIEEYLGESLQSLRRALAQDFSVRLAQLGFDHED
ncbi:MAG: hypothetical protein KC466_12940 [Myxococcales bacterium]|nr:hypothetical protein [Myxococcales bacterium]